MVIITDVFIHCLATRKSVRWQPKSLLSAAASMNNTPETPSSDDAADSDTSTIGTLVGLAVACGALFIMACVFAYMSCRWRMRYLNIQKEFKNNIELQSQKQGGADVLGGEEEAVAAGALPTLVEEDG
ncbi:hypothetical protein CP532_2334 [Ophiocordyceps camponoti-leonardi (nom. inval.)]|nr:hypothetical protein CP532_2334 [Ophiocordyceps camponoti-leonardi (nom. inval.)]